MNKAELSEIIKEKILKAQKQGELPLFKFKEVMVDFPESIEYGDYTTNLAFLSGKEPMKIAEVLVGCLKEENKFFKKIEAAKPGFINFWLKDEFLIKDLKEALEEGKDYGSQKINKTMVIDYSAPNIAKPFGIGHLRSTIIGQAIYNIYDFLGWKCIGDSHLGDWGTQFGKLIVAIKKWWKKDLKELTINDLESLYVKFHAQETPDLTKQAREWFKRLEQKDKQAKKIWQFCVDISLKEFSRVYNLLGVKIDYALGESFYHDKTDLVIKRAKKLGLTKKSRGALIIPLKGIKNPVMLLKSDGTTTYETRDLATSQYRKDKWKPDLIIYEVGADQKDYFEKVFKASILLGYGREDQYVHVAHGLIRWKDRKFSTRKGDTIKLEKVLNEAIKKAKQINRNPEIAKKVGIGAVKYNDLSKHYSKDIVFDLKQMITLKGNSGPYIQYTAVRCKNVLEKAKKIDFKVQDLATEERKLLGQLRKFPEIVDKAARSFSPNLIANFCFQLAKDYNLFYEQYPILISDKKAFRLAITKAVYQILENSLNLLGIEIPDRM
jgi:arginyl-tRNA synthetase